MSKFNEIKQYFPIFSKYPELIYADNAATTQRPLATINALTDYYTNYNANINRGVYKLSNDSSILWDNSHRIIEQWIGADQGEVFIVKNATEGINIIAQSIGENIKENDVIVMPESEHHSNILPWAYLASVKKAKIEWLPLRDDYKIDFDYLDFIIRKHRDRVKIITIAHVSNVLGVDNSIKKVAKIAHKLGAVLVVDGAQSISHEYINVKDLDCDFFVFSGHKVYGPLGTGVVYGKKEILKNINPSIRGGGTIKDVTKTNVIWAEGYEKFEAGTPNIAGGVGLAVTFLWLVNAFNYLLGNKADLFEYDYIDKVFNFETLLDKITIIKEGYEILRNNEDRLTRIIVDELIKDNNIIILGDLSLKKKRSLVSIYNPKLHPHDLASLMDEKNIAIRAGMHCAHPLHKRYKIPASARFSFGIYNNQEDAYKIIEALQSSETTLKI